MESFYDILKISQSATEQEILEAYEKLENKYSSDINKLKKIQIAKQILTNIEARKNYDEKLNELKQNQLISNINSNTIKYNIEEKNNKLKEEKLIKKSIIENQDKTEIDKNLNNITIKEIANNNIKIQKKEEFDEETKKEQKNIEKRNRKNQKKQEKLKKELYEEAYANYLEKLGFTVKRRWTLKRVKKLIITIISIIIIIIILWNIPVIRKPIIQVYENNPIIKTAIDLIINIIKALYGAISSLWKGGE